MEESVDNEELDLIDRIDIETLLDVVSRAPPYSIFPPIPEVKKKSISTVNLKNMPHLMSFLRNVTQDIEKLKIN